MGGGRVSRRNGKMAKGKIEIDTYIYIILCPNVFILDPAIKSQDD
jgi:hypothetical protein